jgi:hypothetical protein
MPNGPPRPVALKLPIFQKPFHSTESKIALVSQAPSRTAFRVRTVFSDLIGMTGILNLIAFPEKSVENEDPT